MSFISSDTAASFSNEYDQFFDYFSRPFVVNKDPIRVINQLANPMIYGYGQNSDQTNFTYVPVTGVFRGRIYYNHSRRDYEDVDPDLKFIFTKGDVTLRVKEDARNFIANGKTINIEFDGKTWNVITEDILKKYLNNTYYLYGLEQTK
jgi:hypothetical protein